ncbi:MAG: FecR domain-containing protein [Bacteroidales bacterium]|nr:FecR domain-containing protein [Bacteroidales bacterium]
MKKMNKTERFTDKEWEELASLLSDEKSEETDLLSRFMVEDTYNTGKQWKELRDMSSEKEINVDKAWNSVYSRLNENKLKPNNGPVRISFMRSTFMRVAAAAVILLTLGTTTVYLNYTGTFSKKITVATGNDQKNLLIALPDGSKIFLNRNTEFSYRANFGKHRRDVRLTGEAFFEISADASKQFIIDAGNAKVKVVGTSFNVITKNSESAVEVYVKTGKVMLSDNSGSQSVLLDPGFVGTLDSKISGKTLNSNPNYLSWNTGLLVYNGQKLNIVFNDLKRVYNMDIVADDPGILENTWTIPIDNLSQEKIIRLICASFILSYTKDGSVYHLAKK